jgi:GT2 family glycosyltransferase
VSTRIDVVILTWNDGELLGRAVESALASKGVEIGVIVVDNGSDPVAVVPCDSGLTLLRNPTNMGVARGRNQGAQVATAPYVCFLDSDAQLLPGTLARLAEALDDSLDVALAAPVFTGQRPEESAGRAPSPAVKALRVLGLRHTYAPVSDDGPRWDVDFAIGACQLVRRDAFVAVGGFDDSYFYGPEDVDLCLRLRERGWRVVQVGAGCEHPPRRRNRGLLTRRGMSHAWAVCRHLWRHRAFQRRYAS